MIVKKIGLGEKLYRCFALQRVVKYAKMLGLEHSPSILSQSNLHASTKIIQSTQAGQNKDAGPKERSSFC